MTIEQDRALLACQHVEQIRDGAKGVAGRRYATVVHELTTLIHSAGVVQALETVHAYTNEEKRRAADALLDHLAAQMRRVIPDVDDGNALRRSARETLDLHTYMYLGRELLATLVWYRRFVLSVLRIDPTKAAIQEDQ